jgi:hypothetical protein
MGRGSGAHGPGKALLVWSQCASVPDRLQLLERPGGRVWPQWTARPMPSSREALRALRVRAQHLGERIAVAILRRQGDTDVARLGGTSIPFDVMSRQHAAEVKTGLASNTGNSCQWRCSLSAAKGERRAFLAELNDKEQGAAWDQARTQMMARKLAALGEVQRVIPVVPVTVGLIVDLDDLAVDVHVMPGWHMRIGWKSDLALAGYRGTFRVEE